MYLADSSQQPCRWKSWLTAHGALETVPLESLDECLLGFLRGILPSSDIETFASVLQRLAHPILSAKGIFPRSGRVQNVEEDIRILVHQLRPLDDIMVSKAMGS